MNEKIKLTIQMAIFFFIIFTIFSIIIIKEKTTNLLLPKIELKLNDYIMENYNDLDIKKGKTIIENNAYRMKVMNKTNNNLYFYISYSNKKISDTYKKDYVEGKTILEHSNKLIEKIITKKTNITCNIKINNTYNNFSDKVKELILEEKNLESLKIYTLETEISSTWDKTSITSSITNIMTTLEKEKITPKNYTITITDKKDITKSVKITNLTTQNIENNNLDIIINDIINNEKTNILSENKITYEYLN